MAEQKAPKAKAKETASVKIETVRKDVQSTLGEKYHKDIVKNLKKQFSFKNIMEVPKITKIVVNRGVGEATQDIKILDKTMEELFLITHQKPLIRRATKSIANFKLRKGQPIGAMTTLRGVRMYAFLEKLIVTALPRIRDFKGLNPNSFDGRGNYTFGLKEQLIFPEVDYDKVDKVRGMNITIVTTAKSDKEAKALLEKIGIPFREK